MRERTHLLVDLRDRRVLVVGGGPTAARKVRSLLPSGAAIHVVAPGMSPELKALTRDRQISTAARAVTPEDLQGCWLVVTCTGIAEVDAAVASAAEILAIPCINAGDADAGTAALPAVARGPAGASVAASGGGNPVLAREIRDSIDLLWDLEVLPLRRAATASGGRVILVGAGPGDPELMTLRGMRAVAEADVLVVDRLAPRAVSEAAAGRIKVIEVGKTAGAHPTPQDEINSLLVRLAREGQTVVRLKGGDPFMMGRGAEEARACIADGIPVEVVPGVTSAVAVPEAAGIPTTCRGIASSFLVATAHEGPEPLDELVRRASPDTTLVLMMGARSLPKVIDSLVSGGRSPETPIAVIESGWTPEQRCWTGTLAQARAVGLVPRPPAVVVIGDVVSVRSELGDLASPSALAGHGTRREA